MCGARHVWCRTATLLASLAFSAAALGNDPKATVGVSTNSADARVSRALVLIRGELNALGLELQVQPPAETSGAHDSSHDRLTLDVKDGTLVVRVFAAGAQAVLVESVDLDGPQLTAEVIAVRAVEALRAARLLPSPTPPVAPPEPRAPQRAIRASADSHPDREPAPSTSAHKRQSSLEFALGPAFVQNLTGPPQMIAHARLAVGPGWGFAAFGAEGSLSSLAFERAPGSALISRRALFFQLGARLRLHDAWMLNARAGLDYLHYRATGAAETGYSARALSHDTAGVSASVGGAYYFASQLGVYLELGGLAAFDAARVRLANEELVTLDQPSFCLGLGLLLGAF